MSAATAGSPPRPNSNRGDETLLANRVADGVDVGSSSIRASHDGGTAVVTVEGLLDGDQGLILVETATAVVAEHGPARLDIDLRALDDFTDEGAGALVACRGLGSQLAEGLHYRTGRGPGREALLTAYQEVDPPASGG